MRTHAGIAGRAEHADLRFRSHQLPAMAGSACDGGGSVASFLLLRRNPSAHNGWRSPVPPDCRASALATATWSASDLCWLSLSFAGDGLDRHDDRPHQHLAARFGHPVRESEAGFGASQLSNCPLSPSM